MIRWVSLLIYNIAATLGLLLVAGFVAGTVLLSYRFAETNFHFTEEEPSTESNLILHLTKYYQQEGASGLSDPKFRLSLETAALYSSLFPGPPVKLSGDTLQVAQRLRATNKFKKILFAAKLPVRLAQAAWGMAYQVDGLQALASRISDLKLLRDSCGRAKFSGIAVECEALN